MQRLWAPWRAKYIVGNCKRKGCLFCEKLKERKDEENYILFRGKHCMVMLNAYPYNNGHLMIAPYRHICSIEELSKEETEEVMEVLFEMVRVVKEVLHPEGFNIGINLGKAGGAGIIDHLHLHIVPRWVGDSNFMLTLSETKVISEALSKTYHKLKERVNQN